MPRDVAVLLLVAGLAVAAPVPKSLRTRLTLNGRWEPVELLRDGKDMAVANPWVWVIDGPNVTRHLRLEDGTFEVDESYSATIVRPDSARRDEYDFTLDSRGSNLPFRVLIDLRPNELTVCFGDANGPRPERMSADSAYYYRFKRMRTQ